MMWNKAVFFNDHETAAAIIKSTQPREQKALGRQVRGFVENEWNKVCKDIVYKGNYFKFSQNPNLKSKLLDTYPTILIEASPTDMIWGIGRKKIMGQHV
jgi:ribA/ribD-fused uncharacterized protein